MKMLVMGAGALGAAAGGFLARAGHEIHLVGRETHMRVIGEKGLHISGIWGEHLVTNIHAHTHVGALRGMDFDLILVAVKSYDTAEAAALIKPLTSANTLVCSYQNGLGNAECIAEAIGWERTIGARVIYGARINQPGEVAITVIAAPTAFGVYHSNTSVEVVRKIVRAMDDAGLPSVYTSNIQTVLWSKVAYNCALNPLSALLDVPYGRLAECPDTRRIMEDVISELYYTAAAMRIPLEPDSADAYRDLFYTTLLPPTAAHYASMREDLIKGRRTEIDALNGAITRFGAQHGVVCPANAMLTALMHAREQYCRLG